MALSPSTIRQLAIALCSEGAAQDIAQAIASGGGGGESDVPFSFGGGGTPAVASVPTVHYVDRASTAYRFTLACGTAPSGDFQVTIKRSVDGGSTFPDTVGTVTVGSGATLATTTNFTHAALSAGDRLRCDVVSVNGAADWSARLMVAR